MIKFNDTEIAFQSLSNSELKKAYRLFKLMGSTTLVKVGTVMTNLAIKIHFPIGWAAKPTLYAHFVGGETIEKCQKVVDKLGEYNVKAVLDYSVEGTENDEDIEKALKETLASIANSGKKENIPFSVFKPTAFCKSVVLEKASLKQELNDYEKSELAKFRQRLHTLCEAAHKVDTPILIDAEDSWYQGIIDEVAEEMTAEFNKEKPIVYNTYQMYRHDRLEYLKAAHKKARENNCYLGAKFVRGAYMEKERERAKEKGYQDPIQPNKESADRDYNLAMKYCVENIDTISIFCGTHNEYSCNFLADLIAEHKLEKDDKRIWFAQLLGMSDNISFNLAQKGYNVAKYTPYGPVNYVMPYLLRRAEENTSVQGQSGRELSMIKAEMKRRKL